jgi:hypothetical protein
MCSSPYQTEVVRTVQAVEVLRDAWKAMPSRIDADFDYFLQFAKVYKSFVLRLHVIVLRKGTQIVAILPGRLERRSLKVRVGYKELTLPTVNQLTVVGQLLGEQGEEAAAEAMKSIQTSLRRKEADVVLFHQADSEESLYRNVAGAGSILTRDYFEESEENWRSRIPGEYEGFLKSRSGNTRHNIRRYSKRLLQAFPGKVQHKVLGDVSDIEVICRDCETIAAKSYHRGLGVGFFDDQATRQLFALAAAQGWLRSYILYIEGRPSAFWNGFLYRSTFVPRDTAYDAGISELRPGLYLLLRLVEDLCANGSACELDFGTGSAQYKRDMCDASRLRVSKLLFAPTIKGVSINALRTLPLALSRAAEWVLTRSGFFQKIRKVWRSRVAARLSVDDPQRRIAAVEGQNDG